MKFPKLCLPSKIYLVLSIFSIILALLMSINNTLYCIIKFAFALFWTWVLDLICKSGYPTVAWVLVLLPIILFLGVIFYLTYILIQIDNQNLEQQQQNKNLQQQQQQQYHQH